jgi:hypothetical protein
MTCFVLLSILAMLLGRETKGYPPRDSEPPGAALSARAELLEPLLPILLRLLRQ